MPPYWHDYDWLNGNVMPSIGWTSFVVLGMAMLGGQSSTLVQKKQLDELPWNSVQTSVVPRGWIMMALAIPCHHKIDIWGCERVVSTNTGWIAVKFGNPARASQKVCVTAAHLWGVGMHSVWQLSLSHSAFLTAPSNNYWLVFVLWYLPALRTS